MSLLKRIVLPLCATVIYSSPFTTYALPSFMPSYASSEHVFLGDKIKIFFSSKDPGKEKVILHLPNGLNLTYGEILSFGDFYEIVNAPISQAKTEAERKSRFLASFRSFAEDPKAVTEATQILAVIYDEKKMIDEGKKKGETEEAVFKKIGHNNDIKFNCLTGGGCTSSDWLIKHGRYLKLANEDFDHFGENALISYKTGHALALDEAAKAHGDLRKLEIAYAMNAFASHFLSDRFATGHTRTPRQELTDHVTPSTIGSLLAGFMHEEENTFGLHVHNERGDHWIAYGDKSYFSPKNTKHTDMINETLQASASQIFAAFERGTAEINDTVYKLIPKADELGSASNLDVSPLFYWDSKTNQLMRRNETTNYYDKHWTADWWGWSTLLKLQTERGGLTEKAQATLALSQLGEEALQRGLITNKALANYIRYKNKAATV